MRKNNRDVLARLKSELEFLERGGYAKPSSHQPFIFQDSPTCLNYSCVEDRRPCSECVLFELVPLDRRKEKIPCRFIPLNGQGETLDSLYREGTQEMIETAVWRWLRSTIQELESECAQDHSLPTETAAGTLGPPELFLSDVKLAKGTTFSKCANPQCSSLFHYQEGRLYRFHRSHKDPEPPPNTHSVEHFWLCKECSESYTLEYKADRCALIKL
jgi:hypothetical protein